MTFVSYTKFSRITLTGLLFLLIRSPRKAHEKPDTPYSPKPQLEDWKTDLQAHEQVAIGQTRGGSEAKMKAFLDEIEKKISGNKEVDEHETEP